MEKIYSGGGFSNYFAMPEYQKDVVDNYLTNYYPNYPSTIWNSTGTVGFFLCLWPAASHANEAFQSRAFPDISANGANYVVAVCEQTCCCGVIFSLFVAQVDGAFTLVYGTSCSSPVVGAIFTMINDARLAIGKGTIGFINPTVNFDIAPRIDEKVLTISPLPSRFIPLSSPVHSTTLPKAAILAAIPPASMQPWDGTLSLG